MEVDQTATAEKLGGTAKHRFAERSFWIGAAVIVLLGGFLRFHSLDSGLPHLRTRPDEDPIVLHTEGPASGQFKIGWPVYPPAYLYVCWLWGEAGLRSGQALGAFPPGDYLTVLREDRARLLLIGRGLSALAGTLTLVLLILLTRQTLGSAAALSAGLLLATNFLHARDSHALKPDVLLSMIIVVAFAAMVPLARRATARTGAMAGVALGAAMAAKYPGVLVAVPVYAAAVMGSCAQGWRRLLPFPALVAGCTAAAFFLATSPFLLFDRTTVDLILRLLQIVFPQVFLDLLQLTMKEKPEGLLALPAQGPGWNALIYHARFSLWYGIGALPTLVAPLAVLWGFLSRRPLPLLASIFATTWCLVVSLSPHLYARYLTPLVPMLFFLEAGFLCAALSRLPKKLMPVGLALGTALMAAQPLTKLIAFNRIAGRTDTRVLATHWLAEELPGGARLTVLGTVFWNWGVPDIPSSLKYVNATPEAAALEKARVQYVLTHEHVLYYSTPDPVVMEALEPRLRLLVEFDPRVPGRNDAIFEGSDAYYIPFHKLGGVRRPGPHIKIYAFE